MTKDDALRMMLGPFKAWRDVPGNEDVVEELTKIINAVEKVLEQPEQEPVPTLEDLEQEIYQNTRNFISRDVMEWMLRRYYTHPPQRTWVEIDWSEIPDEQFDNYHFGDGAKWAEQHLKEKNT